MTIKLRDKVTAGWFGVLYGRPGVGKTSMFAYTDRYLFCGNEQNKGFGIKSLTPAKSYREFQTQCLSILKDDLKDYDTVVVDNFTDLEQMLIHSFAGSQNLATWKGGYGVGYKELEKLVRLLLDGFVKPLQARGKNVIFIAHATVREATDYEQDIVYEQYMPFLEKVGLKPLEAHADWIFHLHRQARHIDKDGNVDKTKQPNRVLLTEYTLGSLAKKKNWINLKDKVLVGDPKTFWNKILHHSGLGMESGTSSQGNSSEAVSDSPLEVPKAPASKAKLLALYNEAKKKVKSLAPLESIMKKYPNEQELLSKLEKFIAE